MPIGLSYRRATFVGQLGSDYERHEPPQVSKRWGGAVTVYSETWRRPDRAASTRLMTFNHPSVAQAKLQDVLPKSVHDMLWTQGQTGVPTDYKTRIGDSDGHVWVWPISVDYQFGLPALGLGISQRVHEATLVLGLWKTKCRFVAPRRCFNDHAYLGLGGKFEVESRLPAQVAYS